MNDSRIPEEAHRSQKIDELIQVLDVFGSSTGSERQAAFQQISALGDDGVDTVLELIQRLELRRRISYRLYGLLFIGMVGVIVAIGMASNTHPHLRPLLAVGLLGWFGILLAIASTFLPGKREKLARALLTCLYTEIHNPAAISPLIESSDRYSDPTMNHWNRLALTRTLGQLKPAESGKVDKRHRLLLEDLIRQEMYRISSGKADEDWKAPGGEYADYLQALLRGAGLLGSKATLSIIRPMGEIKGKLPVQKRVRETAEATIKELNDRFIHSKR